MEIERKALEKKKQEELEKKQREAEEKERQLKIKEADLKFAQQQLENVNKLKDEESEESKDWESTLSDKKILIKDNDTTDQPGDLTKKQSIINDIGMDEGSVIQTLEDQNDHDVQKDPEGWSWKLSIAP